MNAKSMMIFLSDTVRMLLLVLGGGRRSFWRDVNEAPAKIKQRL